MASAPSKVRLVARCAVVSLPKGVREAARFEVGDGLICESVKVGPGDLRIVLSKERRGTKAAEAPRIRMTGERREVAPAEMAHAATDPAPTRVKSVAPKSKRRPVAKVAKRHTAKPKRIAPPLVRRRLRLTKLRKTPKAKAPKKQATRARRFKSGFRQSARASR